MSAAGGVAMRQLIDQCDVGAHREQAVGSSSNRVMPRYSLRHSGWSASPTAVSARHGCVAATMAYVLPTPGAAPRNTLSCPRPSGASSSSASARMASLIHITRWNQASDCQPMQGSGPVRSPRRGLPSASSNAPVADAPATRPACLAPGRRGRSGSAPRPASGGVQSAGRGRHQLHGHRLPDAAIPGLYSLANLLQQLGVDWRGLLAPLATVA